MSLVAAAAVVIAVGWTVLRAAGRRPSVAATSPTGPALHLPGQLLVFDSSTGRFGTAAPDGSQFRPLPGQAFPGDTVQASPDGRQVMLTPSQVVDLGSRGAIVRPPLNLSNSDPALLPFADGGQRIVLITTGGTEIGAVETVDPGGGSPHDLGTDAGAAAGDPTRDGAAVAVQGNTDVNLGQYTQRNTSRVELRWWKGHRTVLATTAALVRAARLKQNVPYAVWPVIAPDGRHVALTLDALEATPNPASAGHALVVTDLSGRVISSQSSYTSIQPLWSPNSRQVAYTGGDGVTLLTLTGNHAATRTLAAQVADRACLFSPAGDYLLCDDLLSGDRTVIGLPGGHLDQVHHDPTHIALAWRPTPALTLPTGGGT